MPDEQSVYAEAVLRSLVGGQAIVPSVWPLEVLNALLAAQRRGRITEGDTRLFLRRMAGLDIVEDHLEASRVFEHVHSIALEYGLSSYDASYLELALRKALPLASLDKKLFDAAARAGVALYRP
ncbi:MAG: type II toxin-antitoxin system VapC family toxin [Candidatus Hydrogenedentes bacterium]|nr:type II toxin-antitoxin system VapC family toxin [Candidatus Hydrogenedentota bacterium]